MRSMRTLNFPCQRDHHDVARLQDQSCLSLIDAIHRFPKIVVFECIWTGPKSMFWHFMVAREADTGISKSRANLNDSK